MRRPEFNKKEWDTDAHREFMAVPGWLDEDEGLLLNWLAAQLPAGAIVTEIGSFKGKSAVAIASALDKPGQVLRCIDPFDLSNTTFPEDQRYDTYDDFMKNTAKYLDRIAVWRDYSYSVAQAMALFQRKSNMLWLDGDHSYEGLKRDVEDWCPMLVKGGIIAFHDTGLSEVQEVVNELGPAMDQPLIRVGSIAAGYWRVGK